jgi:hypothetical protein
MKKIFNIILTVFLLGWIFTSCELEKYPYNSIASEDTFNTVQDATNHLNGLYSFMRHTQYGNFTYFSELQSDLFNIRSQSNGYPQMQEMPVTILTLPYFPAMWTTLYYGIARINNFIANIDNVRGEEAIIASYKAQAHYFRAYFYYVLIKHWGENYESETVAKSKLGVPLVKELDVTVKQGRASLFETYDFILTELTEAETLMGNNMLGMPSSTRVTIDAVKALKSKILLLTGDKTGAAQLANELINSGTYPLNTTEADLRRGWVNDQTTEDIFILNIANQQVGYNSNLGGSGELLQQMYSNWNVTLKAYTPNLIPTKTVVEMYEPNDLRNAVYLSDTLTDTISYNSRYYTGVKFVKKWPGNPELQVIAGTINYRHRPKVARIAEMYLIAAEAEQNLTRLNELREARGASTLTSWSDEELRNEWAREMIGEGVRLECIKRWQIPINGRIPQNPASIVNDARFTETSLPANYYRFTWAIPDAEMQNNPNMRQIPQWENPQ